MSEKRCECFEEIVDEVVKRLSQKRVLSNGEIRDAVEKGVEKAIRSATRGIGEALNI